MCGRFAFFASPEAIARQFGLREPPPLEPRYNISPTQSVPVIRWDRDGAPGLATLRWGLIPRWAKDPAIGSRLINARAETVSEKPAFREAFARRRCLVLASGFYEWGQTAVGKRPFFISRVDEEIMAFAGLWERWRPGGDEIIDSCVIVTTEATPRLAEIHGRMPVMLSAEEQAIWLEEENGSAGRLSVLSRAHEEPLEIRQVDRAVNDPRNEGAGLLRQISAD